MQARYIDPKKLSAITHSGDSIAFMAVTKCCPMSRRSSLKEASPGAIDPELLRDLTILHEFFENRALLLEQLLGGTLPRSPVREFIIRLSVIEMGHGRVRTVFFYQREGRLLAGSSVFKTEIMRLADRGALVLRSDPKRPRARLVVPTERLVAFYSTQMPRLKAAIREVFGTSPD